jgi:asparagine synthetase B (glutamine-hydrolysing)
MFAFAICERESSRVVLARDRLGIKPLYYADLSGRLRFASTLLRRAARALPLHRAGGHFGGRPVTNLYRK